jgi:protein phosphatase
MAMEHGDVYLLCCDGLTDLVADWMVKEIMTSGETLDEVADNLVRAANANGGTDNITVVLMAIFAEAASDNAAAVAEFSTGNKTSPGY